MLSDYSVFRRGILAEAGGWHDQTVTYREAMLTLDAMYAEEYAALLPLLNRRH